MAWEAGKDGEVASNAVINKLKEWFENLSEEEKACYYTGVGGLEESLKDKISIDTQIEVEFKTDCLGGSTIVCAIVGQNDTLIANLGDSRAYIVKGKELKQITTDDSIVQEKLEQGEIPYKEAMRFHEEAAKLTQAIGMSRRDLKYPHIEVLDNKDYDMLLLFSDGVTDCLSEDEIAIICRNTDKARLAKKIVERAIEHDSIAPEELYNMYIPGGKDNTTAAVYTPEKDEEEER